MRRLAWLSGLFVGTFAHFFLASRHVEAVCALFLAMLTAHGSFVFGVQREKQIIREIQEAKNAK